MADLFGIAIEEGSSIRMNRPEVLWQVFEASDIPCEFRIRCLMERDEINQKMQWTRTRGLIYDESLDEGATVIGQSTLGAHLCHLFS